MLQRLFAAAQQERYAKLQRPFLGIPSILKLSSARREMRSAVDYRNFRELRSPNLQQYPIAQIRRINQCLIHPSIV